MTLTLAAEFRFKFNLILINISTATVQLQLQPDGRVIAMACPAVSRNGKSLRVFVRVSVADKKVSCLGKSDSPQPSVGLPRAFAR